MFFHDLFSFVLHRLEKVFYYLISFQAKLINLKMDVNKKSCEEKSKYCPEINRVLSFDDNFHSYSEYSILAMEGFYFDAKIMLIICVFCNKKLDRLDFKKSEDFIKHGMKHDCNNKKENKPMPENPEDYRYECNRICTFLKHFWPKLADSTHPVGALELASCGFIYRGVEDKTMCIYCHLEVRGWETGDIAEVEHKKFNCGCPFMQERSVGNVKLGQEECASRIETDAIKYKPSAGNSETSKCKAIEDNKENIMVMVDKKYKELKHIKYMDGSSRTLSFKIWPASLISLREDIIEAGFFYTNRGDRVICFCCGGGLKDWSTTDNPWVEHAVWFPYCEFLIETKGNEFIKNVQEKKKEFIKMRDEQRSQQENMSSDIQDIQKININKCESAAKSLCNICNDKELEILLLPCSHLATCAGCIKELKNCPICENKFSSFVKAYLA